MLKVVLALFIPLLALVLLYLISRRLAPKHRPGKDKDAPYACGEYFPPERLTLMVNFYWYAMIFLVLDVIDFLLALAFEAPLLIALSYILIIIMALIVVLRWRA